MKLSEILTNIPHETNLMTDKIEIENVTTKTEQINEQTLFIVISGINFDTGKIINNIK